MPKITKIEVQKKHKNRFSIYIDNEFAFGISEDVLVSNNVVKGMEITEEFIQTVLKKEELGKGKNYALYLLSQAPKSELEIRKKMKEKGYEEHVVNYAIDFCKKYNYINDLEYIKMYVNDKLKIANWRKAKIEQKLYEKIIDRSLINEIIEKVFEENKDYIYKKDIEYARQFIEKNLQKKDIGKKKIEQKLTEKGINGAVIKNVLEEFNNTKNERDKAYELAKSKLKKIKDSDKHKQYAKLARYLTSKGFEYEIVSKVLRELFD